MIYRKVISTYIGKYACIVGNRIASYHLETGRCTSVTCFTGLSKSIHFLLLSHMFPIGKTILFPTFLCLLAQAGFGQAVIPLHINYSTSDQAIYGSDYDYAPYCLNSQSDSLATGTNFVVCDTFPDLLSGNFYPKDFLPALRLDSIRIRINHVKNTVQNDSLFLHIAGSVNGIFPQENYIYQDTLILTSSFAPGHSFASSAYLSIPVGIYVFNSFTVSFGFKGAANDTLSFWSGYGYDGTCATQPLLKRAQQSHFFPNSFAYRKEFGQILPTMGGEDIFFSCDTVNGFDTLADGRNYIQNWDVDFFLTGTTAGIPENVLDNSPLLYPNPGLGTFFLHKPCNNLRVISMSGQTVWQGKSEGNSVYLPLPAGFYMVQLETEAGTRIEKLIITDK